MSLLRAPGSVLVYRIQIFSGPSKTALTVPHFVHRQVLTSKRLLGGLRDLEVDPGVPGGVLGGPGGSRGSPGGGPGVSRGGSRGVLRSLLVGSWADLGGSRAPRRGIDVDSVREWAQFLEIKLAAQDGSCGTFGRALWAPSRPWEGDKGGGKPPPGKGEGEM